jgi:hypothetical protein
MQNLTWKEILALGGVGVGLYFLLRPSAEARGQAEETAADILATTQKSQAAFSESFGISQIKQAGYSSVESYLAKIGSSVSQLSDYAATIYDSKGFFDDDEDGLYNVFRQMRDISYCSLVAFVFKERYNKTMFTYLSDFLNAKELNRIIEILNTKYFFKK